MLNYEIVFYHSGKTAESEKTVINELLKINMTMSRSTAAASPAELVGILPQALERVDVLIVIGGLDGESQSTDKVLSAVLSTNAGKIKSNKLIDKNGNTAYLISCMEQAIVVLPDEPSVISEIMSKRLISELGGKYGLKIKNNDAPKIDRIVEELDAQLLQMNGMRTALADASAVNGNELRPKEPKGMTALKIAVIILLILAFGQLAAAGYLYLVNYIL